jgi:S-adenosylmethionine:tRNA ribosyltransferase-isomerase
MANEFFDYELPARQIAQEPCAERDRARLLVVSRSEQTLAHHVFQDLPELLAPGDLLVLNDTQVMPARLLGRRARTGGKWEGLYLRQAAGGLWDIVCQTRGKLHPGETIAIEPGPLELRLENKTLDGHWLVAPNLPGSPLDLLCRHGQMPLPPYVRKGIASRADVERYQTVYARHAGAVAAPTAGLHFTETLFERLAERGIEKTFVTLHVGLGTFQPVQTTDYRQHCMHAEWGELSSTAVEAIAQCRDRGQRVVAVGTTSARLLETMAGPGPLRPWSGETQLYIYPPYTFRLVDALITNFHLPRTTLLLLVGAFAGVDLLASAYKTAIEQDYRFYSYGDAMLIV